MNKSEKILKAEERINELKSLIKHWKNEELNTANDNICFLSYNSKKFNKKEEYKAA